MVHDMEQLVQLAKEGNHNAMKRLYEMNKERILNLGFRYSRNREDAEEILQETFTKAFIALGKNRLKENRSFSSWLYRIGINSSIDQVKKSAKFQVEDLSIYQQRQADYHSSPSPENEVIRAEISQKIDIVLEQVSAKQRMVFVLKHFQHLKIREIALKLNCSEGAVKKQLFRAIRALKKHLGPMLGEGKYEL